MSRDVWNIYTQRSYLDVLGLYGISIPTISPLTLIICSPLPYISAETWDMTKGCQDRSIYITDR